MSINGLNTFVDALFVGQYVGQDALAAISLVFPLTMITNGFATLIGMGSASLLSIAIGNNDEETQEKILGTATLLCIISSVLLTISGWYFAYELLALMGGSGEIQELGVIYYRIILIGSFFRIYGVAINMLIRAEGKVAEAMWYSIITYILNIVLNVVFIVYLGMGVEGAAWSTVIAMAVFSFFNFWYFYVGKKASFKIDFARFSLEKKLLQTISNVGFSAMMLQVMFFVQQVVVFRSLAYYGGDWDITFMGACYRILILVVLPGFGLAQALQPVIGINYGAQNYNRVKNAFHVFMTTYFLLLVLLCAFIMLKPKLILGWMIPDANFSGVDITNYLLMMACTPIYPYYLMCTTLFQGIGKGTSASIILIGREVVLFIPIILLLPIWFGITGIYSALLPVNLLITVISYFMVSRQFNGWKVANPEQFI